MALPLQVEQAGKRSEDLMKDHAEGKGPSDAAPTGDQDRQPEDLQAKFADLEQKYKVLQGKYKKEIENADLKNLQRLENENTLLKREVGNLKTALSANEDLIREVQDELQKSKAPEKPAEPATVDANAILTEEEREHLEAEDLGGKTLEIFLKMARAAGGSELAAQVKNISTQVEDLSKRTENTEKTQQNTELNRAVPEFYTVNDAPEFHAWLDTPLFEGSITTNREDLQKALSSGQYDTVKAGIERFKSDTGWTGQTTPPEEKPPKKPEKQPDQNIEPDESFVNPGDIVAPKKEYTIAEVNKFYTDQTKGRWNGREKEAAAINADILLAQQEGRIKP